MGYTLETLSLVKGILWLLAFGLVVIIFMGLTRKPEPVPSAKKNIDDMAVWPYIPRELMTAPERVLYGRLRQALPEYLIFSQVQRVE